MLSVDRGPVAAQVLETLVVAPASVVGVVGRSTGRFQPGVGASRRLWLFFAPGMVPPPHYSQIAEWYAGQLANMSYKPDANDASVKLNRAELADSTDSR